MNIMLFFELNVIWRRRVWYRDKVELEEILKKDMFWEYFGEIECF